MHNKLSTKELKLGITLNRIIKKKLQNARKTLSLSILCLQIKKI